MERDLAPSATGAGALVAGASLVTTVLTALACVGPLVAILLGVSGMGFLAQYAYLRVPASIATLLLLLVGFRMLYGAKAKECERQKKSLRLPRAVLWTAAALAVGVNLFEYVIFPYL